MLHYNSAENAAGRHAHVAHALVVALHAVCCVVPAAVALFGAMLGVLTFGGVVTRMHVWLHGHEAELLAVSAGLVLIGAAAEWITRKRRRGFPVLFAVSMACLMVNAAIYIGHRDPVAVDSAATLGAP